VNGACHLAKNTRHEELASNHTMSCPAYNVMIGREIMMNKTRWLLHIDLFF
jgi:hypothetical protein